MAHGSRLPRSAWLAIGAVGGALAIAADGHPTPVVAAVVVVVALGSIGLRHLRAAHSGLRSVAGPVLATSIGALLVIARGGLPATAGPWPAAAPGDADAGTGRLVGLVEGVGTPKGTEQIAQVRLAGDPAQPGSGALVEAILPRFPEIGAGDRIAVSGSVQPPGADDFGTYLRRLGAAGSLRSPTLEILAGPDGAQGWLDELRRGSADALGRALPEPDAGLADGILVGLRDRVDRDLAAAFTIAGVSHIVAISGWNIAIVAALVTAALGGRVAGRSRIALTLLAIVGYALVAGASPSVSRAAVMAAIGLVARGAGRSSSALAALGWAVVLLLALDPGAVADPGFALSGTATAGLIAWSTPLAERLGRSGMGRLPGWLTESLAVSLAAEAATLPIVLLTFGRLAIVAPAANLVIVPLVPPAMAAGALALAGGWLAGLGLPAPIATILGLPAWAILGLLIALVRLAAGLPFASLTLAPPWNVAAAAMAAGCLALVVVGSRAAPMRRHHAQAGP